MYMWDSFYSKLYEKCRGSDCGIEKTMIEILILFSALHSLFYICDLQTSSFASMK